MVNSLVYIKAAKEETNIYLLILEVQATSIKYMKLFVCERVVVCECDGSPS